MSTAQQPRTPVDRDPFRSPVTPAPAARRRAPAGMQRVGHALPVTVRNELPHEEVARVLRDDPGVWYRAPVPTMYRSHIVSGRVRAYRPPGTFEAAIVDHLLFARYVGEGRDGDDADASG